MRNCSLSGDSLCLRCSVAGHEPAGKDAWFSLVQCDRLGHPEDLADAGSNFPCSTLPSMCSAAESSATASLKPHDEHGDADRRPWFISDWPVGEGVESYLARSGLRLAGCAPPSVRSTVQLAPHSSLALAVQIVTAITDEQPRPTLNLMSSVARPRSAGRVLAQPPRVKAKS